MLPRTPSRGLQRGHREGAAVDQDGSAPLARREQPLDSVRVVLERFIGSALVARREAHTEPYGVTDRLQRRLDRAIAQPRGRQQRHTGSVHHRRGIGTDGHDVAVQRGRDNSPTHERMLLNELPSAIDRIGEQHGLEPNLRSTGQLPQLAQQPLEPLGIKTQPVEEARIGQFARIKHTGRRGNRREPVADGVCHAAQQLVMNTEPTLGPVVSADRLAH